MFFRGLTGSGDGVMAEQDDGAAAPEIQQAAELLPIVYAELRRLAVALSAALPPGQTLQPTALVHEAYVRLVGDTDPGWNGRRHFFGAAALAMRNILVEQARRKGRSSAAAEVGTSRSPRAWPSSSRPPQKSSRWRRRSSSSKRRSRIWPRSPGSATSSG